MALTWERTKAVFKSPFPHDKTDDAQRNDVKSPDGEGGSSGDNADAVTPAVTPAAELKISEVSEKLWTRAFKNVKQNNKDEFDKYREALGKDLQHAEKELRKKKAKRNPKDNQAKSESEEALGTQKRIFEDEDISDQELIDGMKDLTSYFVDSVGSGSSKNDGSGGHSIDDKGDRREEAPVGKMFQASDRNLKRLKKHEEAEGYVTAAAQKMIDFKDVVGDLLNSSYPIAGVAWGLLTAALPYLVKVLESRAKMREGLEYIMKQAKEFTLMVPLALRRVFDKESDFSMLQGNVEDDVVELFQKLLRFQMDCAVAAVHWFKETFKSLFGLRDWVGSVSGIKEQKQEVEKRLESVNRFENVEHQRRQDKIKQQGLIGQLSNVDNFKDMDYRAVMEQNSKRVGATWEWFKDRGDFKQWLGAPEETTKQKDIDRTKKQELISKTKENAATDRTQEQGNIQKWVHGHKDSKQKQEKTKKQVAIDKTEKQRAPDKAEKVEADNKGRTQEVTNAPDKHVLIVSAGPGNGKSVLARYLVEEVLPKYGVVCYFFFKLEQRNQESAALSAILHALFSEEFDRLTDACQELIKKQGDHVGSKTKVLWNLFEMALQVEMPIQKTVYVVLDALNECSPSALTDLAQKMQDLVMVVNSAKASQQDSSPQRPRLKLLCTIRAYSSIATIFKPEMTYQVGLDTDESALKNLQNDMGLVVADHATNLQKKYQQWADETKISRLKLALSQGFRQRTHLSIRLTFDALEYHMQHSITALSNDLDVDKLLSTLPSTFSEAYESLLDRVRDDDRDEVQIVLRLLVAAAQPLTLRELKTALGVRQFIGAMSEAHLHLVNDSEFQTWLETMVPFFLAVDGKGIVYFRDLTARDFLLGKTNSRPHVTAPNSNESSRATNRARWEGSVTEQAANATMAESCIAYLSLRHFSGTYFRTLAEQSFPASEWQGLKYSETLDADNATSDSEAPSSDNDSTGGLSRIDIIEFQVSPPFVSDSNKEALLQQRYSFLAYVCTHWLEHFRAAQVFNGTDLVQDVSTAYVQPYLSLFVDADGRPISLPWLRVALFCIHLQFDAMHMEAIAFSTIGHLAAFFGHLRLLQRISEESADTSKRSNGSKSSSSVATHIDKTLIHWAAYGGSRPCVEFLLAHGHSIDHSLPFTGRQPLFWAALAGHRDVLELLTDVGNCKNNLARTALGHVADALVDPNPRRNEYRSQLADGFRFLITHVGALTNDSEPNDPRGTVLHFAAQYSANNSELKDIFYSELSLEEATETDISRRKLSELDELLANIALLKPIRTPDTAAKPLDYKSLNKRQIAFLDSYDASLINICIQHGADVEAKNNWDFTPLHCAAEEFYHVQSMSSLLFLLHAGASTKSRDEKQKMPLHVAIEKGNFGAARVLLFYGDASDARMIEGEFKYSPLHLLTRKLYEWYALELAEALIDADKEALKAKPGRGKKRKSGKRNRDHTGDSQHAPQTTINGITAELPMINTGDEKNGCTPLHLACSRDVGPNDGRLPFITLLLDRGANPNAVDIDGFTPLREAVRHRNSKPIVQLLIDKGADVNTRDKMGKYEYTPLRAILETTSRGDILSIVEVLLNHGADPTIPDADGDTPIHQLCEMRPKKQEAWMNPADQIEMMRLMLEKLTELEKLGTAQPVDLEGARELARSKDLVELTEMLDEYIRRREDKAGMEVEASGIADG